MWLGYKLGSHLIFCSTWAILWRWGCCWGSENWVPMMNALMGQAISAPIPKHRPLFASFLMERLGKLCKIPCLPGQLVLPRERELCLILLTEILLIKDDTLVLGRNAEVCHYAWMFLPHTCLFQSQYSSTIYSVHHTDFVLSHYVLSKPIWFDWNYSWVL